MLDPESAYPPSFIHVTTMSIAGWVGLGLNVFHEAPTVCILYQKLKISKSYGKQIKAKDGRVWSSNFCSLFTIKVPCLQPLAGTFFFFFLACRILNLKSWIIIKAKIH